MNEKPYIFGSLPILGVGRFNFLPVSYTPFLTAAPPRESYTIVYFVVSFVLSSCLQPTKNTAEEAIRQQTSTKIAIVFDNDFLIIIPP